MNKSKKEILHVGYKIKFNFTDEETALFVKLTGLSADKIEKIKQTEIYTSTFYFTDVSQDKMKSWFEQRKSKMNIVGFMKGLFVDNKKRKVVAFVTIDSLQLYLNMWNETGMAPANLKRSVNGGELGEQIEVDPKIKFSCTPSITYER